MTHVIPVGTSEPQEFRLENDGNPIDGTGFTVGIRILFGSEEIATVTVDWLDENAGTVAVLGVEDLAIGVYQVRFSLTDGENLVGYFPNSKAPDVWRVVN
jgi:hypothetical protein